MKEKLSLLLLIFIGLLNQSCDPTYKVSISNQTESEITVRAKKTLKFRIDLPKTQSLTDLSVENWIEFKIEPKTIVDCGMAIAGLKNDLPFSELLIITESDTIKADNESRVMDLFDTTFFGNLETPYLMTIE